MVLFETTGTNGGDCTAEFISTTVLLTAAHCTLDDNGKPLVGAQYRIYMGSDFAQVKDADWIYIDPSNVHPNPAYNGNDNDMAVLVKVGKTGMTACGGDSGGPALLTIGGVETIIGLDSYSDEQVDCSGGEFYQRVDTQAAFIGMFMDGPGGDAGGRRADAGSSNDTTQPVSGCAVGAGAVSRRVGAMSPWLAILALLGLGRRRRSNA